MLRGLGRNGWIAFGVVSTVIGIGGWGDDAAVWHSWLTTMNPVLAGFLIGVGTTILVVVAVARSPWLQQSLGVTPLIVTPPVEQQSLGVTPVIVTPPVEPASPSEPDRNDVSPVVQAGLGRNTCPLTPEQLVESVKGRTEVAAKRAIEPFVGTSLTFSGVVRDVSEMPQTLGGFRIQVDVGEELFVSFYMERGQHDDYLASLIAGDHFMATGELSSVSWLKSLAHIVLDNGKLVTTT